MKICIENLLITLENAPAFTLPEMNVGTAYLYKKLLLPLSRDETVTLSCIDLSAFETEDIGDLKELYERVFEMNECKLNEIRRKLRGINPITKTVSYV